MASKSEEEHAVDMRSIVKAAVLSSIHSATENGSGWLVAVLDKKATRVISSVVSMFDIMEQRITLVESLEKNRQPFPEMDVIYFLEPCADSINQLANDFKKKPFYANAHLFFLSKVSDEIMAQIQKHPPLVARIKTFKEMNFDFISAESYVFHLDEDKCFRDIYSDALAPFAKRLAAKLATVCFSLNECPVIRCRRDSPMEAVAMLLVSNLNQYKTNKSWWYHGMPGHTDRPQGVLLLLDRTEDLATPALHSCDYESLANDLMDIKDNVVVLNTKGKDQPVLLSEKDDLWCRLKAKHIADVLTGLKDYLDEIKQRNPNAAKMGAKKDAEDAPSLTDMSKMIKEMPEYQAQLSRYQQHYTIAQKCLHAIQAKNNNLLNMINDVEQTLVSGYDLEGKPVKVSTVIQEMMDYLMSDDVNLKLRLVVLLVATMGEKLSATDLDRVSVAAAFGPAERAVLSAVQTLNPQSVQDTSGSASAPASKKKWGLSIFSSATAGASDAGPEPFTYPSERCSVPLKAIAADLVNGSLSTEVFPAAPGQVELAAKSKPAAQSTRKNQGWNSKKPPFTGGRNIIFMAGGLTRAEMHAAANISRQTNKEIVIGGTSIINPAQYLEGLRSFGGAN